MTKQEADIKRRVENKEVVIVFAIRYTIPDPRNTMIDRYGEEAVDRSKATLACRHRMSVWESVSGKRRRCS